MLDPVKLMYDYAQSWPDKVYKHISPSSLGRCMRAHYFQINGIKPTTPPGPGALLNFELGRLWETPLRNSLLHAKVPFMEQYKIYDEELNVEGTLDFAVFDPRTDTWEVWDSKTEGLNAATYRKREGKTFFGAHPEYVIQLATYALLLKRQGFKVPRGRFIIITKDNGLINEEPIEFSELLFEGVLDRVHALNAHLAENQLPDCECHDWQVGYCSFGDPNTQAPNRTKKMVNTHCCPDLETLEEWRKEYANKG